MDEETYADIELPAEDPFTTQAQKLNDAAMWIVEHEKDGLPTAMAMLRRALALKPKQGETWSNLGLVLWRLNRVPEAGHALQLAVDLDPTRATFQGNLGVFLGATNRFDKARFHLQRASEINPDNLSPQWDLALLHLRVGNWKEGLAGYDIRRAHKGPKFYPELPAPLWRGESLDGKTIYIQAEQGIGDRILFSRYLAWLKETWPTCTVKVCLYDAMTNLFWEFRDLVTLLPHGVPWPDDLDYAAYLCTLPEIHGTTLDHVPPDPGLLKKRVLIQRQNTKCNLPRPDLPSVKVGICWTGNPEQTRNLDRSIPLEMMLQLTEDPRLVFYSFQCAPGNADLKRLAATDLVCDLSKDIEAEGWVGTGMALMEMDVLVSVCTSVVHMAGAIGIPCWTMLCADPYWVWSRSGSSTPFYPGMRLFRQRELGDWQPVLDEVRSELSKLADIKLNNSKEQ